jgi:hypothetical protein
MPAEMVCGRAAWFGLTIVSDASHFDYWFALKTASGIIFIGAMGQLGSELIGVLRSQYGKDSVIATDIRIPRNDHPLCDGGRVFLFCLEESCTSR